MTQFKVENDGLVIGYQNHYRNGAVTFEYRGAFDSGTEYSGTFPLGRGDKLILNRKIEEERGAIKNDVKA
jgi:hypothetical protein